ncbi:MAG TPA: hypothetical protein VHC72_09635 [Bryobacteraceae bacterium]|nr:hypothetical protein [Bryobacteraceae bacterium]
MRFAAPLVLLICLGFAGCGSSPEPAAAPAPAAKPAPPPVKDHTSLFPDEGKTGTHLVQDHILDIPALPGGSVAEYNVKGKTYQMFIIDTDSNQNAAFMMLDIKHAMAPDPDYMAHIGGYFGTYKDKPLYCFAKLHYLAGVYGLPRDKADPLAIELAAHLD